MKTIGIILVILAVAIGAFLRVRYHRVRTTRIAGHAPGTDGVSTYLGLRNQVLQGSRAKIGLAKASTPTEPSAALMEMGVSNGTATIVAFADGTASIYLSSGGGYIGGGQGYESIRKAGENMLVRAQQMQPIMHATQDYPLPRRGQVIFYVGTEAGVLTAEAAETELQNHRHALTNLYAAGQDIITQYRLISAQ